jgi:Bax protein
VDDQFRHWDEDFMLFGRHTVPNCFRNGWWRWQQCLAGQGYVPALLLVMMIVVGGDASQVRRFIHQIADLDLTMVGKGQAEQSIAITPPEQTDKRDYHAGDELFPPVAVNLEMVTVLQETKFSELGFIADLPLSSAPHLPEGLGGLEGDARKKEFIGALLPTVMVAVNEVSQERRQLLAILTELGGRVDEYTFSEDQVAWQQQLGSDKSQFVFTLVRKYRTASAAELVAMVNVLPPSLILAQGAIESAWGGSRYALEANNLFGMYSSGGGSQLNTTDGLSAPRIKGYGTILESVRAYVLNINRLPAYRELRRIRSQTLDPMLIAEGLTCYSERKAYYIKDVKHIITLNKLQDYDALIPSAG